MFFERDVFRLGRDTDYNNSAGNWCAADDRLDSSPIHDETHSMLLSSVVAAKPEAMSFFCGSLVTLVIVCR